MNEKFTQIKNELITTEKLDVYEFRILCLLISYSNNNLVYPSYRTISKFLHISQKKVVDAIQNLIEKGYLLKENRTIGKGKKTSNCYYIDENIIVSKNEYIQELEEVQNTELFNYDWLNDD